jgi:uncharacterized membrane protein
VTALVRVLHVAATCTSLGGLAYARLVLLPSLAVLPEGVRERFVASILRRFAWIKWTGVGVVAVTGVAQWWRTWPHVEARAAYLGSFALKMSGAIGLVTITFLLALPGERTAKMRDRRALWAGVNLACGVMILVGAALMRARSGLVR